MSRSFYAAFAPMGSAAIIGAGGKTTLLFTLARQARDLGMRVLVSTSTRIFLPRPEQYDALDLTGRVFLDLPPQKAGVYVAGRTAEPGKMRSPELDALAQARAYFDLVLFEADGSKCKPLKGWRGDEPVIFPWVDTTIAVLDLTTIGKTISDELVHRLPLFLECTGARDGDILTLQHLQNLLVAPRGMWAKSMGRKILFCSKLEEQAALTAGRKLQNLSLGYEVILGSSLQEKVYA